MTETVQLRVPDLGDFEDVEIIEVFVAVGDTIAVEDPLITIETDKASIDVPAEVAGKIVSLSVDVGSKVSTGNILAEITPSAVPDKLHDEAQVVVLVGVRMMV
ncbi:MAG: biotin/lipoyl-binding protein, partial [Woeseiaceae bacterium]|nr:biotin/lipoyl-binding protein [Woeseiaceae bacterium]